MNEIVKRIIQSLDWDLWRSNYSTLTFDQHKQVYDGISPKIANQKCYNLKMYLSAFELLEKQNVKLKEMNVVELGSHDGRLALNCMKRFKINKWTGYEISKWVVDRTLPEAKQQGFVNIEMNDQLWKMENIGKFDIFICSHTIEHLTNNDYSNLINFLCNQNQTKIMILEIPIGARKYDWKGYGGTHILKMSKDEFINEIKSRKYSYISLIPNIVGGIFLKKAHG